MSFSTNLGQLGEVIFWMFIILCLLLAIWKRNKYGLNNCFAGDWRPAEVNRCYGEWGRHCFTTSPDFKIKDSGTKEVDASIKRVPVKVGAELQVCSWSHFSKLHKEELDLNMLVWRFFALNGWNKSPEIAWSCSFQVTAKLECDLDMCGWIGHRCGRGDRAESGRDCFRGKQFCCWRSCDYWLLSCSPCCQSFYPDNF